MEHTRMGSKRNAGMLAVGLAVAATVGCAKDPEPFRPLALQADQRDRSVENTPAQMAPLPTTFVSPIDPSGRPTDARPAGAAAGTTVPTTAPGGIAGPATAPVTQQSTTRPFRE